jgi:hypothetical protein
LIYRKLGASPLSQAVARAGDLGLLDRQGARVVPFHPDGAMPPRGGAEIVRGVARDWNKVPGIPVSADMAAGRAVRVWGGFGGLADRFH